MSTGLASGADTATGMAVAVSAGLHGLEAAPVRVEVSVGNGLPCFTVVGLGDAAVSEARERVRAAIAAAGAAWPIQRIVVNLAPAHVRKSGSGFDLPIAIGILAATGQVRVPEATGWVAELSLDGIVRGVRGVLPAVTALTEHGCRRVVVAEANANEAALVGGAEVIAVRDLRHAVAWAAGDAEPLPRPASLARTHPAVDDLADVRGQPLAKRALEIAAAGGHNLLLTGSPGGGKTMLARRLPSILPPLQPADALEVTRIRSVAGLLIDGEGLCSVPPFRAPHHSVTVPGLVGGGAATPIPGEVSLAHRGVLFLDELAEFSRQAIQALRQPIEEGVVTVVRSRWSVLLPARCIVVAATNPCPCGWHGIRADVACQCKPAAIHSYRSRLAGPVLDRIDLQVGVPPASGQTLLGEGREEASEAVRARVAEARERQRARAGPAGAALNADLPARGIVAAARLTEPAARLVARAVDDEGLTGRAAHRVIRVARTIADLAGVAACDGDAVAEALAFRLGEGRR